MIRGLLFLIIATFALTYGWGWVHHVKQGPMDTQSYTEYYEREVMDQASHLIEYAKKALNFAEKPLPARKEAEFLK